MIGCSILSKIGNKNRDIHYSWEYMSVIKDNDPCNANMSFSDCELAILRQAVDKSDLIQKEKIANTAEIKHMTHVVESFIIRKENICYGGTAINNILPKRVQFYNRDVEVADYDFYSKTALDDAKELADIFYKAGYKEVEAKAGVHVGTYKVFVNFIPMADITEMHPDLFDELKKESIKVNKVHYAPPNFLRMSMYIELSRPMGDVSRWEKVLKRLVLLNEHFPLNPNVTCSQIDFKSSLKSSQYSSVLVYYVTRNTFINEGVVFFGGYASSLYTQYMPNDIQSKLKHIPDFDVLCIEPEKCIRQLSNNLVKYAHIDRSGISALVYNAMGDVIPRHIKISVHGHVVAVLYEPIACHNYNEIQQKMDLSMTDKKAPTNVIIKIATIDTMLSFYLAFIYVKALNYDKTRLLCMSKYLFDVEQENRLKRHGLLKRFSINCYGKQPTLNSMRSERTEMFAQFKKDNKVGSTEYDRWFLKYTPQTTPPTHKKPKKKTAKQKKTRPLPLFKLQVSPANSNKWNTRKYKQLLKVKRGGAASSTAWDDFFKMFASNVSVPSLPPPPPRNIIDIDFKIKQRPSDATKYVSTAVVNENITNPMQLAIDNIDDELVRLTENFEEPPPKYTKHIEINNRV